MATTEKPILTLLVKVFPGSLSDHGWERLGDALNDADLKDAVHDFVTEKLSEKLPKDDRVDWFSVTVEEEDGP